MPRKIRTADKILLILNFFGDIESEEENPFGLFSTNYGTIFAFSRNKIRRNNFQQAVSRSCRQGYLEKRSLDGRKFIRLTAIGRNRLLKSFPNLNFRQARNWDGYWRLASFDVDESFRKVRGFIRAILSEKGFARLHNSLYISPFRIEGELGKYLTGTKVSSDVRLFTAKSLGLEADRELASSLWRLDETNDCYRQALADYRSHGNLAYLREKFLEIVGRDPHLPDLLLPDDWAGREVEKVVLGN